MLDTSIYNLFLIKYKLCNQFLSGIQRENEQEGDYSMYFMKFQRNRIGSIIGEVNASPVSTTIILGKSYLSW